MASALGAMLRAVGRSVDRVGVGIQGSLAYVERLVPQTTSLAFKSSAPATRNAAFIAPNSSIVGNATVNEGASVWFGCNLRGDNNAVIIGEGSAIGDRSTVVGSKIGAGVSVGSHANVAGATVGDDVAIGSHVILGDGVTIGARVIIESGSVVPAGTTIQSGQVVGGNPAVEVRAITDDEIDSVKALAAQNLELAQAYAFECDKSDQDLFDEADAKQIQEQLESDHWRDANVGRNTDRQGNIFNRTHA